MATFEEDYISPEIARLLKEKGFDAKCDKCYAYFADDDIRFLKLKYPKSAQLLIENRYPCITLQMAMKWLVREHRLYVNVTPSVEDCHWTEKWHSYVEELNKRYPFGRFIGTFNSHEQACEAAIKYCLERII